MGLQEECKRYYFIKKISELDKLINSYDRWKWGKIVERIILVSFQKNDILFDVEEKFFDKDLEWANFGKMGEILKKRTFSLFETFNKNVFDKKDQVKNIETQLDKKFIIRYEYNKEKISYFYPLEKSRLEKFLELSSLENISIMIMRYACLASNGQQWSHSVEFYKFFKNKYDVEVEGFASPLNSKMLLLNSYFCSLFPKIDKDFGSLCKFGDAFFENVSIVCNPPFIASIIEESVNFAIKNLEDAKSKNYKVRYIFTFPIFEEKFYFKTLNETEFLATHFFLKAGEHSYENLVGKLRKFSLDTHFYVLSYGYEDDISNMHEEVKNLFVI